MGEVQAIRLLYCDCSGLRKCRIIPMERWAEAQKSGIGCCEGNMAATAFVDTVVPGSGLGTTGELFDACPRVLLAKLCETITLRERLQFKIGFETEFYLLHRQQDGQLHPVDQSLYCQTAAVEAVTPVLDEMVRSLKALDIDVEQFHPEAGTGQFEITTTYLDPLQAADNLVYTRETIAGVAAKHNLVVAFTPKVIPDEAGSACHCHISVWQDGRNLMQDFRMPHPGSSDAAESDVPLAESFVAGILTHLQALALWTLPSPLSCHRVRPSTWSGAYRWSRLRDAEHDWPPAIPLHRLHERVRRAAQALSEGVWGVHNREATLRVCPSPDGMSTSNVEYKAIDNCINPHLAVAALICAGVLGIKQRMHLPDECTVDPASLSEAQREERGILPLKPHLDDLLHAWKADAGLQHEMAESLTPLMVQCFVAVRQAENKMWKEKYAASKFEDNGYPSWLLMRY